MQDDPALTAIDDQLAAASVDVDRLLAGAGVRSGPDLDIAAAPAWVQTSIAAMGRAIEDGTLQVCQHLIGPQPCAVRAEVPTRLVCLSCFAQARAYRTCASCGAPAGAPPPGGGVEDLMRVWVVLHSRVLCMSCASPADPG
ncbi:hypothetical protein ACFVX9_17805 [Kitasatospora sp. NPDC058243]|uniref:hypothetical protein n=1 Tax=Kitasatospora sp. NPDC058243 TaxID=3346397 RepID=UPI0036DB3ABA